MSGVAVSASVLGEGEEDLGTLFLDLRILWAELKIPSSLFQSPKYWAYHCEQIK